jgi:hypothetical protein
MDDNLRAALRPRPIALDAPMDLIAGRAKKLRVRTRAQWGAGAAAVLVVFVALWTATLGSPLHRSVEVDRAPKEHIDHASRTQRARKTHAAIAPLDVFTPSTTRQVDRAAASPTSEPTMSFAPINAVTTTTTAPGTVAPPPRTPTTEATTTTTTIASPYPKQLAAHRITLVVDDTGLHGPATCACAGDVEILFLDQRVTTRYTNASAYVTSQPPSVGDLSAWVWQPGDTEVTRTYLVAGDYFLDATAVADELGTMTLHITG